MANSEVLTVDTVDDYAFAVGDELLYYNRPVRIEGFGTIAFDVGPDTPQHFAAAYITATDNEGKAIKINRWLVPLSSLDTTNPRKE